MDYTRTTLGSLSSAVAPLLLAAAALLAGPALSACDGSAPGVVLGSDTRSFAFTDVETSTTTNFRLSISAAAIEGVTAASLGLVVDVVVGGPALEVSVTPPGGVAVSDSDPDQVTSQGVMYDRYVVSLGDAAPLCGASGACDLDYGVVITRSSATGVAFTAIATVSGVVTGDVLTSDDVALDFL